MGREFLRRLKLAFDKFNAGPFVRMLESYQPEVTVCTHPLPAEIISELRESLNAARVGGIDPTNVLVDPGIGFAKDADQSIEALRCLPELRTLGRPIVVGASRKSFLKKLGAGDEEQRAGHATAAAVAACAWGGAHIVRVHDVAQAVQVLGVVDGIRRMA